MKKNSPNHWIDTFRWIGAKIPTWTQGGGGNLSEKKGDILWIKPTGSRLDEISSENQLALLDLKSFLSKGIPATESDYSQLIQTGAEKAKSPRRPSMEAGFHAALPKKYVFHFHSLAAVLACQHPVRNQDSNIHFVPWIKPGRELAAYFADQNQFEIYLMKNHGVVLQSDDLSIMNRFVDWEISFCRDHGYPDLARMIQAQNPWDETLKFLKASGSTQTPLKFYFPDTAVFVEPICEEMNGSPASPKNRNAAEIWVATQVLFKLNPQLDEIPQSDVAEIAQMPTEMLRKNLAKGLKK